MTQQELSIALEKLVDQSSLKNIVFTLATICHEKGEHIAESYGDINLRTEWDRDGDRLDSVAERLKH